MIRLLQLDLESEKMAKTYALLYWDCVVTEKLLHQGWLFGLYPSPSRISRLASYFSFKKLAIETSPPLKISDDLPWCGYRYFLDQHISRAWKKCRALVQDK